MTCVIWTSARRTWKISLVCVWRMRRRRRAARKTVALNAADEVAVAAFLDGSIGFDEIPRIIEDVVSCN